MQASYKESNYRPDHFSNDPGFIYVEILLAHTIQVRSISQGIPHQCMLGIVGPFGYCSSYDFVVNEDTSPGSNTRRLAPTTSLNFAIQDP